MDQGAMRLPLLYSYAVVVLMVTLFSGCRADRELTMEEALSQGKGRKLVKQYESKLEADPTYLIYQLNLSILYALSCRLDNKLSPKEIEERREKAIQAARSAFNKQLALSESDTETLLYTGGILAQIYAVFGELNKMKETFDKLSDKFSHDQEALGRIQYGRMLLENRVKQGYPLDVANPFQN